MATSHSRKTGSHCVGTPVPQNAQQLRSFLGLVNCYAKFIPNLVTVLNPLNLLLKKDSRWNWSSDCTQAFQLAKDALTSSKVLAHFDPAMPIKLAADASGYGVGAVNPIAFALRTQMRDVFDKCVHCLRAWNCFFVHGRNC